MMQYKLMPRATAIRSEFGPSHVSLMYVPLDTWRELLRLLHAHYEEHENSTPSPDQVGAYIMAEEIRRVMEKAGIQIVPPTATPTK